MTNTGLNPGFMNPESFFNTTNAVQSKFNWGPHGYQAGPGFNSTAYNQAAGTNTPWGLQQIAGSISPQDMQDIIAGTYQTPAGTGPASRMTPYLESAAGPSYGQVQVGPATPATVTTAKRTSSLYTDSQKAAISAALGSDWQSRLDAAALNGDYAIIAQIQNSIAAILNPAQTESPGNG